MNKGNYTGINKLNLFLVLPVFLSMVITPLLLNSPIQAAVGGLKVNVHVNGAGKVCVYSAVENLGCKDSIGPGVVNFQFSEGSVAVGDKFTACFKQNCVGKINGPQKAPEDVYPSGSRPSSLSVYNADNGSGGAYSNGSQVKTQQPQKIYNATSNPKEQVRLFCEQVNQGKYKEAVGIAASMGIAPIDAALRGGCMGFGLGEYLSLNNVQ